jgi:hypothetical protein
MNDKTKGSGQDMLSGVSRSTRRDSSGALDKETQTKIGQQLRAMYDDVVRQGVPDRFADLLKELDRREDEEPKS